MASLAPQPIHLPQNSANTPASCPQSPPSPQPLAPLALLPTAAGTERPTITNSPSSATPTSAASGKPVVYRSMCDIGDVPRRPRVRSSASSTSTNSTAQRSRANSSAANGHNVSSVDFAGLSLAPVESTPALPSLHDTGSDPAKGLARATTSPNLPKLYSMTSPSAASTAPHRPPPTPLNRGQSDRHLTKRLSDSSTHSPIGLAQRAADKPLSPQKESVFKRVGSFLGKKSRSSSSNALAESTAPLTTVSSVATGKSQSTNYSTTNQSPFTTPSSSPPSPSSREQTIMEDDELAPHEVPMQKVPSDPQTPSEKQFGHGHSISATDIQEPARATTPRPGITWGPNYTEDGVSMPQRPRRRSISQDNMSFGLRKKKEDPDGPVELMATFSFRSAEGVGLKARRLSTTLPAEFHVDSCELNEKFVSSSHVPFLRGKTVGKGATAVVKLMHKKNDPSRALYAVKEYRQKDRGEDEEEYVKKVQSEYSIAHSLRHPNIVSSVALCTHHKRWNNVMEYCQYGELYHWVEKGLFKTQFKLADRNCFFKQLVRGIDYLHSHGIAHRDIKLENLLLTGEGHLKITDFGVSDVFWGEHPGLRSADGKCGQNMVGPIRKCAPGICGSLPYIAPEVLTRHTEYDPRALDVWSCAIVYVTMTYGGGPWNEAHADKDSRYKAYKDGWVEWLKKNEDGEVTDDNMPKLPGMFGTSSGYNLTAMSSPPMRRLMIKMLHPDPEKRMTINEVLQTNLLKSIECCTQESYDDDCCQRIPSNKSSKDLKKNIMKRHNHIPPKEHKTPLFLQHRFDMGDGYR